MIENKRTEVAFNIGVAQSNYVGSIYRRINNSYLAGDSHDWFWSLNCMKEILYPDLKELEISDLDIDAEKILIKFDEMKRCNDKKQYDDKKRECFKQIINYHRKIMNFVRKAGYLPSKKDRTRLGF